MMYKLRHWGTDVLMDLLAKIRSRTDIGSKWDIKLGRLSVKLLNKQMELRKAAGKVEIECSVTWGVE